MHLKNTTLFIWDMDGTLLGTHPATLEAFNEALHPFLKRKLEYSEISKYYGPREEVILEKLVGKENVSKAFEAYIRAFAAILHKVNFFDGIEEVLSHLQEKKMQMAIFTGRGREGTDLLIRQFKLDRFFPLIVTNTEVENKKPHPEGILHICKTLGVKPQHTVMIGDSGDDVKAARRAGTRAVGCAWDPICKREKLEDEKPHHLLKHPLELLGLL